MRLLLVEDETDLRELLADELRREGYAVDAHGSAGAATEAARLVDYDLAVLDITLPDGTGFEVCEALRAERWATTRVLFLTARDELRDRVRGLDLGADDYLVKPFDYDELAARLRALLRRPDVALDPVLVRGDVELDPVRRTVRVGGTPLALSPKAFAVLRYLLTGTERVISQEELLEHVWDANADPFTDTVRVTVGVLRRRLDAAGATTRIETVTGAGYRLTAGEEDRA